MYNTRAKKIMSMLIPKPGTSSNKTESEGMKNLKAIKANNAINVDVDNSDPPLDDQSPLSPVIPSHEIDELETIYESSGSEYFPSDIDEDADHTDKNNLNQPGSSKENKKPSQKKQQIEESLKDAHVDNKNETDNRSNKRQDEEEQQSNTTANDLENVSQNANKIDNESENEENIYIRHSSKDGNGKRNRDKCHCCLFCNKMYKELSKHLQRVHSNEIEVLKLLALPTGNEKRRKGFIYLARVGDYYHNCEVLKSKNGELVLARMPTPEENAQYNISDYGPCPDCLGFMIKKHLWHHLKYSCTAKVESVTTDNCRRQPMSESTALLAHTFCSTMPSSEFIKCIISPLKNDKITLICRQDNLIMKFAAMQFEKYHNTQNELIRQSMRQLGRLLAELRQLDSSKIWLALWLMCEYFDSIILAVKNICRIHYRSKARPEFGVPSLALKLGYSIKKCVSIEKGLCLRKKDFRKVEMLNGFLDLMNLEWSIKISSNALATLSNRKINATELLPLTDDLLKLNKFLDSKMQEFSEELKRNSNYQTWSKLASATLCKIVLFNKRRSGEASRMTVLQYSSRPNYSQQATQEFQNTFSALEKQLASRLAIIQITGKRSRIVNVLLTNTVKEVVDLLLSHRAKFVSSENPYLFARSNPSIEHIRGHDCLRKLCEEAELREPKLINGTKLRKYIATVCQVFDLTENETDWLARHLGHDIKVHREFYRLHDSSIELTKVSRILLAVEKGEANKFKGKRLQDINISDLPELDIEDSTENERDDDDEEGAVDKEPKEINETVDSCATTSTTEKPDKRKNSVQKKRKLVKRPWSDHESAAVLSFFRNFIKNNIASPGKQLCVECIKENQVLSSRSWTDVKYFVYNYKKRIVKKK